MKNNKGGDKLKEILGKILMIGLIVLGIVGLIFVMLLGSAVNVSYIAQGQQTLVDAGLTLKEPLRRNYYHYHLNDIKYSSYINEVSCSEFLDLASEHKVTEVWMEWIAEGQLKMFWFEINEELEGAVRIAYIP